MNVTEFLLARIAEDELLAGHAAEGEFEAHPHWRAFSDTEGTHVVNDDDCLIAEQSWGAVVPNEEAEHIACWDPARVLAECEAKRAIVQAHPYAYDLGPYCHTCTPRSEATGEPFTGDLAWPCPTLRALVAPYRDHPDCDDAWLP